MAFPEKKIKAMIEQYGGWDNPRLYDTLLPAMAKRFGWSEPQAYIAVSSFAPRENFN